MSQKTLIWEFTAKDIVMMVGFMSTIVFHYFALVSKVEVNQARNDARFEIVEYRISDLEKQNTRTSYSEQPKVAVLPQSIRVRKGSILEDIN